MKAPVFVAPAMDLDMYAHPATQANIERLRAAGNIIMEPASGALASGLEGKGRMEEPEDIVKKLDMYFDEKYYANSPLWGKTVLITAGPTHEKIDPVRFIGNYSSGKMGFALAEECARRGAKVKLVAGPVSMNASERIERIDVETTEEMFDATVKAFDEADAAILCAAVADFKPAKVADNKIKRGENGLTLQLQPTHDIAAELGRRKKRDQILVGFALETNDEERNAKDKLQRKKLDFIVMNSTRNKGTTFGCDDNQVTIISNTAEKEFPKKPKTEVARDIIDELEIPFREQ